MWAIYIDENTASIVSSPDGHGDATVYPYREVKSSLPENELGPFTYSIVDGEVVGERTVTLTVAKNKKVQMINAKAAELLGSTDWHIVKWKETGGDTPQDIVDYRTDIRSTCNTKEQEVLDLTSVSSVEAFDVEAITWPVDPTVPVVDGDE